MSIAIDVLGGDEAAAMFAEAGRQAPFAQANTLTALAKRTHEVRRNSLGDEFTLRKATFVRSTIRRTVALKTRLEATVYVDPEKNFLAKFEAGGPKEPQGEHIAVPLPDVQRTAKSGIIVKAMRPKALLDNPKAAKVRTPRGLFIVLERNAVKKKGLGRRTEYLYELKPRVVVRPQLGLERTAQRITEQEFTAIASREIDRALSSAKQPRRA